LTVILLPSQNLTKSFTAFTVPTARTEISQDEKRNNFHLS